MSDALKLSFITRTYGEGDNAITPLSRFSMEIKKGEAVALVGPSGSGKSTLLQIAGLLDNPTSGEVIVGGQNMSKANDAARTEARRKYLGFVYQSHHLLPEFTALENVVLPQMIAGISRKDASTKAFELLASLGLEKRTTHRPAKLSGGEQQRVAIARALANDPALLLADEPTGNLDPHTSDQVFNMFLRLAKERGLALLVATHNMELAARLDRTVRLG
jgi:lipoprotein-releasing system ATP-binding protein